MEAKDFLEKNGFTSDNEGYFFYSKTCRVTINSDYYSVLFYEDFKTIHSVNLNIYWLIGVLTYHRLIDKNYNQ